MEFDKYADNYDAGFMGKGSGRFYADLIKEIEVKDGDAVLDVGCGTGTVLSYIGRQKKISGFGLDVSEKMVAIAKEKNPDYQFVSGDSASLPYVDESMDVVMACMAYHHFPDQEQFRNEAMRVLKPGGSLYISDPRFPLIVRWIFNTFFKDAGFRTTKKNRMDFERSGFQTVSITKDVYVQVVLYAVLAALFYAINIPCSKLLLNNVAPTFMAAFLYLGAGLGVGIMYVFHAKKESWDERIGREDIPYTLAMVVLDIIAPILLMIGVIFRRGELFFFLEFGTCSWSKCLLGT